MKALHYAPLYQYLSTLQQPTKQREAGDVYGFTVLRFYVATTKPAYDLQGKGITVGCGLPTVKSFIGY
jgi:hypothetical protein